MSLFWNTEGSSKNSPLLLLHGFMGSGQDFQNILNQITQSFYCFLPDLPGHGNTGYIQPDDCYTMEKTAHQIIEFIQTQSLKSVGLVGYSMGGRLALYLGVKFPQYFSKIMLESSSPGLQTEPERQQRREKDETLAQQLENQPFETFLTRWYHNPLFESLRSHPQFSTMYNRRLQNSPPLLAKSLRYLGTGVQPSLWEDLPSLQTPLLLLVGEKDPKFCQINQKIAQLCPVAQLQVIKNCGHNIHLENQDAWVATVQQFFNGL